MLCHAGVCVCVCVCAWCAAQGLCSIPGQSQPSKAFGLLIHCTRMASGVHQSHTQSKGAKLPLDGIFPLHNPPQGATTAGATTKCQGKLLQQKHINVTHIAVCRLPRAPSCAPTLPRSTSCLHRCHSPSSIQGTDWSLIEVGVKLGPRPCILPPYLLQWEVGV